MITLPFACKKALRWSQETSVRGQGVRFIYRHEKMNLTHFLATAWKQDADFEDLEGVRFLAKRA